MLLFAAPTSMAFCNRKIAFHTLSKTTPHFLRRRYFNSHSFLPSHFPTLLKTPPSLVLPQSHSSPTPMPSIMGNFLCLSCLRPTKVTEADSHEERLRIVKIDGKILEYGTSLLVKELLVNLDGYGVGVKQNCTQHLPPNYELKLGCLYYLLPAGSLTDGAEPDGFQAGAGIKRIKVVISKQQLQQLMSKKMSVEEVLLSLQRRAWDSAPALLTSWRPELETILEDNE